MQGLRHILRGVGRLFVIRTRFDASLIIFALALGAFSRGQHYLSDYPGWGGRLLLLACAGSVVLAGAKIFDCLRHERALAAARMPSDDRR